MQQSKSSHFGHKAGPGNSRAPAKNRTSQTDVTRRAVAIIAVISILAVIATSTFVALRQGAEQDHSLQAIEESGRLRHDLDQLQQILLDEHGALYTSIATTPFYRRAEYRFPLAELLKLTRDASDSCRDNNVCLARLADLDDMIGRLSEQSNDLKATFRRIQEALQWATPDSKKLTPIFTAFWSVLSMCA